MLARLLRGLCVRREVLCVVLVLGNVSLVQTLDDLLLRLIVTYRLCLKIVLIALLAMRATILCAAVASGIILDSILRWTGVLFHLA